MARMNQKKAQEQVIQDLKLQSHNLIPNSSAAGGPSSGTLTGYPWNTDNNTSIGGSTLDDIGVGIRYKTRIDPHLMLSIHDGDDIIGYSCTTCNKSVWVGGIMELATTEEQQLIDAWVHGMFMSEPCRGD